MSQYKLKWFIFDFDASGYWVSLFYLENDKKFIDEVLFYLKSILSYFYIWLSKLYYL